MKTRQKPALTKNASAHRMAGIVVNPKTRMPCFVEAVPKRTVNVFTIGTADVERIGEGYFEGDESSDYYRPSLLTGYPRSHTPKGVSTKGTGYGTVLYVGMCLAATIENRSGLGLTMPTENDGICSAAGAGQRSREAGAWWDEAVRRGLASRSDYEDEDGGVEKEDDINLRLDIGNRRQRLEDFINENFALGEDGEEVTYVNSINVDIRRTGAGESLECDVLEYDDALKLVALAFDQDALWDENDDIGKLPERWFGSANERDRVARGDNLPIADHLPALVSLDLPNCPEWCVEFILGCMLGLGATDEEVGDVAFVAGMQPTQQSLVVTSGPARGLPGVDPYGPRATLGSEVAGRHAYARPKPMDTDRKPDATQWTDSRQLSLIPNAGRRKRFREMLERNGVEVSSADESARVKRIAAMRAKVLPLWDSLADMG